MTKRSLPQEHGGVLHPIQKGEVRNPWGRPPKKLTSILKELKEEGFERVTKETILEAYEVLLGMNRVNLLKTIKRASLPYVIRLVAKEMLSKKGNEMLEKMLDRAHGRAKQTGELKVDFPDLDLTSGLKEKINKYADTSVKKSLKGAIVRRVVKRPPADTSVKPTK